MQDAGNTTTLAHYLELLSEAGFVTGLSKFSGQAVRRRASSPKLQVFDTALITAQSQLSFEEAKNDSNFWGRLVESAIGAHLLNITLSRNIGLSYWREGDKEVDFVVQSGKKLIAIEVKSSVVKGTLSGMTAFSKAFAPQHKLLVGRNGIPIGEFLKSDLSEWLGEFSNDSRQTNRRQLS